MDIIRSFFSLFGCDSLDCCVFTGMTGLVYYIVVVEGLN